MQVTTLLPQRVSVDIGDMGVLYGNLLDNAIEAAMAVEQEKRYVHVESKFQEGRLLLSIKNSKPSGTSSYQQTSKKDKIKTRQGNPFGAESGRKIRWGADVKGSGGTF